MRAMGREAKGVVMSIARPMEMVVISTTILACEGNEGLTWKLMVNPTCMECTSESLLWAVCNVGGCHLRCWVHCFIKILVECCWATNWVHVGSPRGNHVSACSFGTCWALQCSNLNDLRSLQLLGTRVEFFNNIWLWNFNWQWPWEFLWVFSCGHDIECWKYSIAIQNNHAMINHNFPNIWCLFPWGLVFMVFAKHHNWTCLDLESFILRLDKYSLCSPKYLSPHLQWLQRPSFPI